MDKQSDIHKGFGFMEVPKSGGVKAAIKNLSGKELSGMNRGYVDSQYILACTRTNEVSGL